MALALGSDAGRRTVWIVDAALVAWIIGWAWLGVAIHGDVQDLRQLTDTVITAGNAVQTTGRALQALEQRVAVVPSAPLLILYVPFRVARARQVRGIRRAVAGGPDPVLEEFLARRAAAKLPYRQLRRVTPNPWEDLASGRHDALARAELRRLGIGRRGPGEGS